VSIYYEDDYVQLHLGDCRGVRGWTTADVLVTDPPYGMDYTGFGGRKGEPRRSKGRLTVAGDATAEARDAALELWGDKPALVFGRWNIARPGATRHRLVWDKQGGPGMGDLGMPWGNGEEEIYVLGRGFVGKRESNIIRAQTLHQADARRPDHPTPKPVALMEALIEKCPPGVIADPFAGSGATLIAARNLGRKAIGVEIDEKYCELIVSRLSQQAFDFSSLEAS
jgi:site-specific DNA-methyltransferase (adenine-specific)